MSDDLSAMSGRRILRRFSSSISDLLSIQRKSTTDEKENGTALHTAVQMGNSVMAQGLLEGRNVWVDEEDGKGRTALHYAMEQNSTEITALLLRCGANVDCVDFQGISACHLACQEGMIDAFNLLLYYRADICAIDKNGKTPFDLACEYGQDKMVECILTCGVDMPSLKKAGNTHTASALHLAARNGHSHIIVRLLEAGWNINHCTSLGSALHEAAGNGRGQVVRFLIHARIDTALTTAHGHTALDVCKKNAHKNPITIGEIKFLLREHKKFVYGEALRDHLGVRADELSFSKGDLIWIIDRGTKDGKDKGVIFGQKANSRSGLFDSKAVKIVDRPQSVIGSMSSRISMGPMLQTFGPGPERKPKKFDIPVVPKINVTNSFRNSAVVDVNRNHSSASSYRSPSGLSDDRDSQNGNSRRPLNSFGTEVPLATYHKQGMASAQYASTSCIPLVETHRQSTGSNCSQTSSGFESMKNGASSSSSASSFHTSGQLNGEARTSIHSSASGGSGPSSLASCSVDALDESFSSSPYEPSVDVTQMVARGIPEAEILAIWLDKLNMSEYLSLFLTQGYDLSTIARITPEDLINVGVANPEHRKLLMTEIHSWHITDSWPTHPTQGGLRSWLEALSLPEYIETFYSQRYNSVQEVVNLSWEDLEDVGIKRLGHLKRILLASKKIKEHRNMAAPPMDNMKYITNPVQVHSPRLQARPLECYRNDMISPRLHDPPPPAPTSSRGKPLSGGIDYFSYSRGPRTAPIPPTRSDDYATYGSVMSDSRDTYADPRKREPLKLNFYGTGQILSEMRERDNVSIASGSTLNLDIPPAPAPLAIDNSIRRLQDACASSASIGSISSGSSFDIPFANENCGTIRARDVDRHPNMEASSYTMSAPPPIPGANCPPRPSILKNSAVPKENVLNSIGSMLDSLTAELDGMLEPYNVKKQRNP